MTAGGNKSGRWTLSIVFLTFFLPVAWAYFSYFFAPPKQTNNYGELIQPQRDVPSSLALVTLQGAPFSWQQVKGRWVLLQVVEQGCDEACQQLMFYQRQIRTSTGKDQSRIERLVVITDDTKLEQAFFDQFKGVHFVKASKKDLQGWLAMSADEPLTGRVYVVDPLAHYMMRFPTQPKPERMRKDIVRLLWVSKMG